MFISILVIPCLAQPNVALSFSAGKAWPNYKPDYTETDVQHKVISGWLLGANATIKYDHRWGLDFSYAIATRNKVRITTPYKSGTYKSANVKHLHFHVIYYPYVTNRARVFMGLGYNYSISSPAATIAIHGTAPLNNGMRVTERWGTLDHGFSSQIGMEYFLSPLWKVYGAVKFLYEFGDDFRSTTHEIDFVYKSNGNMTTGNIRKSNYNYFLSFGVGFSLFGGFIPTE